MKDEKDLNKNGGEPSVTEAQELRAQVAHYRELYAKTAAERNELRARLDAVQGQYDEISHSLAWRLTKPWRAVMRAMKKILVRFPPTRLMGKLWQALRTYGLRVTLRKVKTKLSEKKRASKKKKRALSCYSETQLAAERAEKFEKEIRFSILVPLYNTPIRFLKEMIASVQAQTYADWELCLADGSDGEHADVGEAVAALAQTDARIRYQKLEKNLGISENTNACLKMASGDYIALFDHDDLLHPSALYRMMCAICKDGADFVYTDEATFISPDIKKITTVHHKPDFSPDLLRSYNYICHFTAFSRELLEAVGGFRSAFDGSQDYDMILRLTEQATCIRHIPEVLYFWRSHAASVASDISAKPYTLDAARRALGEHLERVGLQGRVQDSRIPSTYRISYTIEGQPKVSVIIPNMDHADILKTCVESVESLSTYGNYEILIVENNSRMPETFALYDELSDRYANLRVIRWESGFNYSAINNFAVEAAKGEYLIFLNNDIEIITPSWIEEMLMFAQREDVGAAGMMLYYPDDTVQHAGVILGIGDVAGHSHKYFPRMDPGYMSRMSIAQNLSAVTAACMMVKTSVFREVGGFDDVLAVAFNDVDLCLKIRRAGYLIVFTPYGEAYHHESKSRGYEDTPEKVARFKREVVKFRDRWESTLAAGDPYYNPNLTHTHEDFSLE